MRRSFGLLLRCLAAFALLAPVAFVTAAPVAAAPLAATGACATGVGNQGGAGIICEVTIVNNITSSGGTATVTVHECLGSAGDPTDGAVGHPCTTTTTSLTTPVTSVTQCDGSVNGGGSTLRCSVVVTDNFVGVSPGATAATVNQCVGSGDGLTTGCSPFPATTTSAAITQCNGSANGGTLVGMTCTATGTMSSALPVTINQCNGSGLKGGSLVICSATMTNTAAAPATPTPTTAPSLTPASSLTLAPGLTLGPSLTPAPTSTAGDGPGNSPAPFAPLMILLGPAGLALTTIEIQRRSIRS